MRRLAVVGVDSSVGSAIMVHFDGTAEVSGVRLAQQSAVGDLCDRCTDIVVCGDASLSSWDDGFGDLKSDCRLVPEYCQWAERAGSRLVYISSDAIFGGPWVFHDDDSSKFFHSPIAQQLQSIEQTVLKSDRNLVIRTNAISDVSGSWLDRIRNSFRSRIPQRFTANQYATPLAACRLALLLDHVLQTPAAGVVHLAGAERLSAWNFATQIARAESVNIQCALPSIEPEPREQSLRCTRARNELRLRMPTLSQTIAELTTTAVTGSRQAA